MGTPRNLYGLGFSPLSISNKASAVNEEMLANKDVGLTAYMANGNIISAEYIARIKEHLKNFTQKCIRENTIGEIYKITITDELVKVVRNPGNIFDNTVSYEKIGVANKPNTMRFDLDFDIFQPENSVPAEEQSVTIKIEFTMDVDGVSRNYFIQEPIEVLNDKVYKLDWTELERELTEDPQVYTLTINTFEISSSMLSPIDPDTPDRRKFVIYNLLFGLT